MVKLSIQLIAMSNSSNHQLRSLKLDCFTNLLFYVRSGNSVHPALNLKNTAFVVDEYHAVLNLHSRALPSTAIKDHALHPEHRLINIAREVPHFRCVAAGKQELVAEDHHARNRVRCALG